MRTENFLFSEAIIKAPKGLPNGNKPQLPLTLVFLQQGKLSRQNSQSMSAKSQR